MGGGPGYPARRATKGDVDIKQSIHRRTLVEPSLAPSAAWPARQRVGWQPSRFLADRAQAERAFALAERLGSINAAAQELGTTWPSLRKAFARHGLGMPARNPQTVRQRGVKAARRRSGQPDTPGPDSHGGSCLDHVARWRNAKAARFWRGGVGRTTAGEVGFEPPDLAIRIRSMRAALVSGTQRSVSPCLSLVCGPMWPRRGPEALRPPRPPHRSGPAGDRTAPGPGTRKAGLPDASSVYSAATGTRHGR